MYEMKIFRDKNKQWSHLSEMDILFPYAILNNAYVIKTRRDSLIDFLAIV